MISIEKLSLFNIDNFRKIYDISYNSYICDNDFFEIYEDESFIVKYIMRKQVRLFKYDDKYIGYIWFEYPCEDNSSSIYSFYIEDEYIKYVEPELLNKISPEIKVFKFDALNCEESLKLVDKFQFKAKYETVLMKLKSSYHKDISPDLKFKHFKKHEDEDLRCVMQNTIFNDKNRIPLTIDDIYAEENEHYYIDDFGIFICIDDDTLVGYGQVILNRGYYTVVNFGILNEYRGRGYGLQLLKYIINLCHERYIDDIYIRVEISNTPALSLYKKCGFSEKNYITTWVS